MFVTRDDWYLLRSVIIHRRLANLRIDTSCSGVCQGPDRFWSEVLTVLNFNPTPHPSFFDALGTRLEWWSRGKLSHLRSRQLRIDLHIRAWILSFVHKLGERSTGLCHSVDWPHSWCSGPISAASRSTAGYFRTRCGLEAVLSGVCKNDGLGSGWMLSPGTVASNSRSSAPDLMTQFHVSTERYSLVLVGLVWTGKPWTM